MYSITRTIVSSAEVARGQLTHCLLNSSAID